MSKTRLENLDSSTQHPSTQYRAIARWDGEGGAGPDGPQMSDYERGIPLPATIKSKKEAKVTQPKMFKNKS